MTFTCPQDGCTRQFDTKRGMSIHNSKSHTPKFQDEEWLEREYIEKKRSTYDIAEECGVGDEAVRSWMERFGIDRRGKSEAKQLEWEGDEERRNKYADRMKEVGESHSTTYWDTYSEEELKEVREKISEAKKGSQNPMYGTPFSGSEMIRVEKTGNVVRSGWEAEVDCLLYDMGINYRYEPKAFRLGDLGTYTPDFIVSDENVVLEVKGFASDRGVEKAVRFMDTYPTYTYTVIGGNHAKDNMPYDQFINYENMHGELNV